MKGTVVIISMVHWHFTWQIQQSIARGLAERGYDVRFLEPLPKRWPGPSEFGRVWGRLVGDSEASGTCRQPLAPGVALFSPRLLPDSGRLAQAINRRFFTPSIAELLQRDAARPLIVINYLPLSASLALMAQLRPNAAFYHCVNDWEHDPYTSGRFIEAELCRAVDMVWADSPVNLARTTPMSNNVVSMAGGVDVALFARARRIPTQPPARPLCAYFGTIGISTDLELLRAVSRQFPLRLIGPVRTELDGFGPDTQIVGPVPQERLPELLHDADVLLLPYVHSAHNKSVIPAKLFECLATGKPTIVSGLDALSAYAELFHICATEEEFLAAIAASGAEPPERRLARIACAEQNSYDQLITTIEGYFHQALARHEEPQKVAVLQVAGKAFGDGTR